MEDRRTLCLSLFNFVVRLKLTDFYWCFPNVQVRDIYDYGDYLILVTTDRQSAFDRVLASIPFKGQVGRSFTGTGNYLVNMEQGIRSVWLG